MYLNFYGLKKHPSQTAPDPEFLYLSPTHQDALAKHNLIEILGESQTAHSIEKPAEEETQT